MLRELSIENLAVIEKASVEFGGAFNVFTGETGAGKSVIIGGINAVLGGRTNKDIVRSGAPKAVISALFDDISDRVKAKLSELGFSSEDGELVLMREITSEGKSSARINGRAATAAMLREVGELLVDIHGQHENRILMNNDNQRQILDSYGELDGLLEAYRGEFRRFSKLSRKLREMQEENKTRELRTAQQLASIGIGCPGTCNQATGVVEYSNNLGFVNAPLRTDIESKFSVPTYLGNDADAAAYGEYCAGAAKGAGSAVVITLGTGVGSGIIIDGKIYSGSNFAGGEIGHTVIEVDGRPCTCGRKGCFEAYSSATGLVNTTREYAEKFPDSLMAELIKNEGKVSARTAYIAMKQGDEAGKLVTDLYVKYLAVGITNVINIFQPDILCIGGGVCNEGDTLLVPLKKAVAEQVYSKRSAKNTEIVICSLGNDAGIIGAAMLHRSCK